MQDDKRMSPEAVKARLNEFCGWFDIEPPRILTRKGSVHLTAELMRWFEESGASMDWILRGDGRPMASKYRQAWFRDRDILDHFQRLDDVEKDIFLDAMAARDPGAPLGDLLSEIKTRIEAHRAQKH